MYSNKLAVKKSFRKVKMDVLNLQRQVNELKSNYESVLNILNKNLTQKKVVVKKANKAIKIVASSTGKKVHKETCAFAKNIMPKNKVYFSTKEQAYNKGYKPCMCMLS
jgi:hypothetical protein